ncbi:SDR family oxidoreductase [Thioalkalivibrio sp. XN8]|uniref:SDR family oxidoreductase n=1 Tax=Thioalkalivibrio sp. XN8 TaxID=2712863 RepID=UPI0013EDCD51|nr:SDR family oxidoreductase [Thioalkalivibrio sp. XN8]NGP52601.1 SDR family oxidoreductase [Thioalkalivibrio sp. XN8]
MSVCLVTGANRGIGLALCRQLVERGDQVIAACRHDSDELEALGARVVTGVDVGDPASIRRLAEELEGQPLDWIINNAGVLRRDTLGGLQDEALDDVYLQFRVNSVGPLLVTQALLGNLQSGSRVGIVTSRMGSMGDNDSGGYYGYRMSKAAVNAAGRSLAMDLKERGIAVALLHPGYVRTGMTDGGGDVEPMDAAAGLIARMDELNLENTGSFWHAKGQELPW